jgi:hypothetical protein
LQHVQILTCESVLSVGSGNPKLSFHGLTQRLPNDFDGDTVIDPLEKAFHDHVHGFQASESATHTIKKLFFIDLAARRPVGTTNVVGFNLKARDRINATGFTQKQAVVSLIAIGFLRDFMYMYLTLKHAARLIIENGAVELV